MTGAGWRRVREAGVAVLSALVVAGVMRAVYAGGWMAVAWCGLLWASVVLLGGKQERQLEQSRRMGYRAGYSQGWRDNADRKDYEPWPT